MRAISTFRPRALPQAVFVGEDVITGPFCETCGFTLDQHVHGTVRGGKNRGKVIDACPPPNGLNPMDRRCVPCTLKAMKTGGPHVAHKRDGLFHEEAP